MIRMIRCASIASVFAWACVIVPVSSQVSSQAPIFVPASPVNVGEGSGQVVLADLNRDGHLDMVTRHLLQQNIAVSLGNGKGGFTPASGSPIRLNYSPGDAAVGDVNGDGTLDLAVTASERDALDVFLGAGTGAFTRVQGAPFTASSANESYTHALYLVDLNGDRHLDAVTANLHRNRLATLLGDGRGRFSPGPAPAVDPAAALVDYDYAFGDVDGDGQVDFISAGGRPWPSTTPGLVVVRRGNGRGAFTNALGEPVSVPTGVRYLLLSDVNGDRRPDLVISHQTEQISILLNDGGGAFGHAPGSPIAVGADVFGFAVADINRDQKSDLVAATVDSVTVFTGDGRRFVRAPGSPFAAGPGAYNLTLGDINKDGKPDVAAASFEANAVTLLLGQ